jgi:Papain family cysteine protease
LVCLHRFAHHEGFIRLLARPLRTWACCGAEIKGKECPAIGICQNCMPINGTDTCWPVKTPILYQLKSYGKIRDGGELGIMSEVHKNGYSVTVLLAEVAFDCLQCRNSSQPEQQLADHNHTWLQPNHVLHRNAGQLRVRLPRQFGPQWHRYGQGLQQVRGQPVGRTDACTTKQSMCATGKRGHAWWTDQLSGLRTMAVCSWLTHLPRWRVHVHPQVDHDIEVVGWGEEDGVPFWNIRNSWGTYWGELGFFRLERGKNALQIESGDCWCAPSLGFFK